MDVNITCQVSQSASWDVSSQRAHDYADFRNKMEMEKSKQFWVKMKQAREVLMTFFFSSLTSNAGTRLWKKNHLGKEVWRASSLFLQNGNTKQDYQITSVFFFLILFPEGKESSYFGRHRFSRKLVSKRSGLCCPHKHSRASLMQDEPLAGAMCYWGLHLRMRAVGGNIV